MSPKLKFQLKKEQLDSKSANNIAKESNRKTENDKLLNWRTERDLNQSPIIFEDKNLPTIRNKNVNLSHNLNRLIVPKISNLNCYVENSKHKDNSHLMKDLIRKRIETMGKIIFSHFDKLFKLNLIFLTSIKINKSNIYFESIINFLI